MADLLIGNIPTTATVTAADDYFPIGGATYPGRNMSAATPAFLTSVTVPIVKSAAGVNLLLKAGGTTALTLADSSLAATCAGALTSTGDFTVGASKLVITAASGNLSTAGTIVSSSATGSLTLGAATEVASLAVGATGAATLTNKSGQTMTFASGTGAYAFTGSGAATFAGDIASSKATGSLTLGAATEVASLAVGATGAVTLTNKSGETMTFASGTGAYSFSGSGMTTFAGGVTITGVRIASVDTRSGAGAVSVTKDTTELTTTAPNDALTLANGVAGQFKRIVMVADGGDGILTPTTATGFTTVTFTAIGNAITLQYHTTLGWMVLGNYGCTIG